MGSLFADRERRRQKGKLREAAWRWAGGGDPARHRTVRSSRPDPRELADLIENGAAVGSDEDGDSLQPFRIWRPGGPLFELFTISAGIWRLPPMGGLPLGLDWPQLRSIADGLGIAWTRDTITCLQGMEGAAIAAWGRDRAG